MVTKLLNGTCLCGKVAYQVLDAFEYALNCHCSQCRRATCAPFKSFAGIERSKLTIIEGKDNLLIFGDDEAHDTRCVVCGSFLFSAVRGGLYVHVTLGTLMDAPSIRPTAHIFVGSKAPWYEITDDLPQRNEF